MSLTSLGSLLALDNILAALALAPFCRNRTQFLSLIAWFAAVEAMAPSAGAILQPRLTSPLADGSLPAAIIVTLGLSLLGLALTRRSAVFPPERLANGGWPTAALAIVLGLDNLLAGTELSLPSAALCGVASAAAVLVACIVGRTIGLRLAPQMRAVVCGILLVAAGAMTWA
jgi:putative Mn2+ efflux pump MntP